MQIPPTLDFIKEEDNIKMALRNSKKSIGFLSKVATKENFEQTVRRAPKILHISCHGISRDNGNWLLFENPEGAGELVSEE